MNQRIQIQVRVYKFMNTGNFPSVHFYSICKGYSVPPTFLSDATCVKLIKDPRHYL